MATVPSRCMKVFCDCIVQHLPWHSIYGIAQSIQRRQKYLLAKGKRVGLECLLLNIEGMQILFSDSGFRIQNGLEV